MSIVFDAIKKSFNDVTCFVKFFIKRVNADGIRHVGNTGGRFFLKNKIANLFRTESIVREGG